MSSKSLPRTRARLPLASSRLIFLSWICDLICRKLNEKESGKLPYS